MKLYLWLAGIGLVAFLGSGWYITSLKSDLKEAEKQRDDARASATAYSEQLDREREEVIRVNYLLETLENKEAEIRYVDKIIKQEIIKYRDRVVNRCQLSDEWLSAHNKIATGRASDSRTSEVPNTP